jgi:hypothetical protein
MVISTDLSNYYGTVYATKVDDKYYLCLDDHSHTQTIEISEEFFLAFEKEFKE